MDSTSTRLQSSQPHPGSVWPMALLALAVGVDCVLPDLATARGKIPVIRQITNNSVGDIFDPRLRMQDGSRITFVSDGDVMGPGTAPGHREVYLYHIETDQMVRVTTTTGLLKESWDATRATDDVFDNGRPEIVALISNGDHDPAAFGGTGNVDGNPEVFLWEVHTGTFHQLTDTSAPVVNSEVFASDSGLCIVFSSNGDLDNNPGDAFNNPGTGFVNIDGSREVFVYSLNSKDNYPYDGNFTQATNGPDGTSSWRPVIGGYWFPRQCQSTAYMSDHDQTGSGLTGTNIFVFNRQAATNEAMLAKNIPWGVQPGDYLYPMISSASPFARGPFVVFQTNADVWLNGLDGSEVFRYRVFHPRMEQYTDILNGVVERPVVSDGGGYVVFQSNGEMLYPGKKAKKNGGFPPFNADGNTEIFRLRGRRRVQQVTRTENCENTLPSVRDDATAVTFRSTCDLVPGSNAGNVPQVFLYHQVKKSDALSTSSGCKISEGCCNEANGCYVNTFGKKPKPRKKECLTRPRAGCKPPPT